jgi:hypothetical protein
MFALVLAACADKTADDTSTAGLSTGETASNATTTTGGGDSTTSGVTEDPTAGATGEGTTGTTGVDTGGPPGGLVCPELIDQGILECVATLQSDPDLGEKVFLLDILAMCSDAEPVAVDYDTHCAAHPDDPICSLEYEVFVTDVLPQCVARVQAEIFADVCLLPATYGELLFTPSIALMDRRFITDAAALSAAEQTQIVWASGDMGFPVDSAAEALLATDDDGFEMLAALDVGTDRALVLYTAHYGDTLVGRMFFLGSLQVVGAVEDGAFSRCAVERTTEGQPCGTDMSCGPGFVCVGVLTDINKKVLAPGACVSTDPLPPTPPTCDEHADCDPPSGQLCLDNHGLDMPGQCRSGWMRHSFAGPDTALTAGKTTQIPIVASGVATVPNIAYLDLQLSQDSANPVAIRLVNPSGSITTVVETDAALVVLDLEPVKVAGDESAGGRWQLEIEDIGGNASGAVSHVALTLDTRWD